MSGALSRDAAVPLVLGLLVVAGIGMTGAALPFVAQANATDSPNQGQQGQNQSQGGAPSAGPTELNSTADGPPESDVSGLSRCVEPLDSTPGTALVVVGFLGIVALVFKRFNFSAALLVGWTALPPVALAYFLFTNCASTGGPTTGGDGGPSIPGSGVALDVSLNVPPWALLGVAGVVLLGAVGLMVRSMNEEDVVVPSEEVEDEPDLDEFAAAAGRAADRIEEHAVDVDNAVYRAWVEMTDLIEVDNPDVYSPGEFAQTAVDLGMDEADVNELTRLFNEVRYGDRDASTREDQAVAVLRNIEAAYGDADGSTGDSGADPRTDGTDPANNSTEPAGDGTDPATDDGDDEEDER